MGLRVSLTAILIAWLFTAAAHGAHSGQVHDVTFTKDVAPVFYQHCVSCHHPNDIAPMSLLTYQDARPWAVAIREAVVTRTMPPWHADPHYGTFSNDPSLTEKEIAVIQAWVKGGAKEGDPKLLPPAPVFDDGWKIGKPDLVIDIGQDHKIEANGADEYDYFTVPTSFTEDKWVTAVEIRPSNRRIVHHGHLFLGWGETSNRVTAKKPFAASFTYKEGSLDHTRMDAPVKNDGCSDIDAGNEGAFLATEGGSVLGSYLPGRGPDFAPAGTAKLLPAGAKITFNIHYSNTTGEPQIDRTQAAFKFASAPPERPLHRIDLSNLLFEIPAGAEDQQVSECHTFDKDIILYSLTAHMHFRGKDMRFDLVRPDGSRETLLNVPRYSFQWQQTYRFKNPPLIEGGSRLIITAHFDNSTNNPWNPDPTKIIRHGSPSYEEMMDGWVEYVDAKPNDEKKQVSSLP